MTANLPATGKPLPRNINKICGRDITFLNDCRALDLSEAVFGLGQGHKTVLSFILGTDIGRGISVDGTLWSGPNDFAGDFGHLPLPAHMVA